MFRILIADDEKEERDVIVFLLNKYNFKLDILQAPHGKEAMRILSNEPIDILFTDIKMPFLNGMELAAKARDLNPNIEILFFSGYDDFEYVKTALSLRVVNYILKPVDPEEFKKSISDILNIISLREMENAKRYIEKRFFHKDQQANTSNLTHEDRFFHEDDSLFLKNIKQSIRMKNPESLKRNADLLLDKYKSTSSVSHIYIRYLCITLLYILVNAFPDSDANSFERISKELYALHSFPDIYRFIEGFLDDTLIKMNQGIQSSNHAIYLVEQYIHTHYSKELSLDLLADAVFLSPKYLSSMFIQVTGIGLNEYIKNVRMEKAQELLLTTNLKIIDICQSVGYSNASYFCKVFQKTFKLTPDQYRQSKGIADAKH